MPQLREDQALIHVDVSGVALDNNAWTSMDGGDLEAQDTKTRPGGMGEELNLGGPTTRSDLTVMRQYTNDVLHPLIRDLEVACGSATMSVRYTPLDADGNPAGETHTITGKLKGVPKPKWDANAQGAAFLSLVMGCDATPVSKSK